MALVKVKDKFQITLPLDIRRRIRVAVGDYMEAEVSGNGTISFYTTKLVNRAKKRR